MKQILCFGDSNTYGLIPGTGGRYGWGERWTSILDGQIRDYGYRVVEEGLCGRTTVFEDPLRDGRNGAAVLPMLLETHKPIDMVILMLGTNDCKTVYDASAEVIGRGIERLLNQISFSNPDTPVLLISPIHLGERVWEQQYDPEFNKESIEVSKRLPEVYQRIAANNHILHLRASEYAAAGKDDYEHLDRQGHRNLANAIFHKIESVVRG